MLFPDTLAPGVVCETSAKLSNLLELRRFSAETAGMPSFL